MANEEYSILNELEIGILIVDSSKRIEYCNRAAIDLLGKSGGKAQKYCYELLFGKESPCQKCFGDIKGQNSEIVEIELADLDRFVEISVKKSPPVESSSNFPISQHKIGCGKSLINPSSLISRAACSKGTLYTTIFRAR